VDLRVQPRNQGAAITVETFNVPEAKKGQASMEQCQSDVDYFFCSCGVVHHECTPQGQNINKEYYQEVLRHFRDAVQCKRSDLWAAAMWQLHHDNAPAHSSQLIQVFLAKHNIPMVQQATYTPDMAPCNFWLIPHLKMQLKGTQLESRDDIVWNTTAKFYSIHKEALQNCFEK
jgi:histone-lysine N-methyltransferase SETMAR